MPIENIPPLFDYDGCFIIYAAISCYYYEGNARDVFYSSLFIYLKLPKISYLSDDVANVIALTPITGLTSVVIVGFSFTAAITCYI